MSHSTKRHPQATKSLAAALFASGMTAENVGIKCAVAVGTIRQWVYRYGWSNARRQSLDVTVGRLDRAVANVQANLSQQTRNTLAQGVHKTAQKAFAEHVTEAQLTRANIQADIASKLTKSADVIHGWTAAGEQPLIQINQINVEEVLAHVRPDCVDADTVEIPPLKQYEICAESVRETDKPA